MPNDRTKAVRVSEVATDLVFEVATKVTQAVAAACGESSDLVRYVVGAAFVAVGAAIMQKYQIGAPYEKPITPLDDAIEIVRGIHTKKDD